MIQEFISKPLNKAWPFWVLDLNPDCSNSDIRKAAQLIGSKLALGAANANFFDTPSGKQSRDDFLVREAKAILDDPAQRLVAEFWYAAPKVSNDIDQNLNAVEDTQLTASNWLTILRLKWPV